MTVASQHASPGLALEVARALGIDAEPLSAPPLQLWPAEGRCTVSGQRVALSRREIAPGWVFIHTHRQFGYRFAPERRS